MTDWQPLGRFLADWVRSGEVSAVVGLVGGPDGIHWRDAATDGGTTDALTRFDLASLTKPFVASLALVLDGGRELALSTTVGAIFPQVHPGLRSTPLADLLRHRSGLVAWTPLYARCRDREEALALLLGGALLGAAPGTYSDLGYLLWGMAAETAVGCSLAELLRQRLLVPLGLERVTPSPGQAPDVAPCHLSNAREQELAQAQGIEVAPVPEPVHGVVQDGNARFWWQQGHLAGHAGLFATAADVFVLARQWLRPGGVLVPERVKHALAGPGPFLQGWERWSRDGSAGEGLGPRAFGHTGFTGTSVWIDPEAECILVLLAHRRSSQLDANPRRRQFHRLVPLECLPGPRRRLESRRP